MNDITLRCPPFSLLAKSDAKQGQLTSLAVVSRLTVAWLPDVGLVSLLLDKEISKQQYSKQAYHK